MATTPSASCGHSCTTRRRRYRWRARSSSRVSRNAGLRLDSEAREKLLVVGDIGVSGRQQLLAVENRVGAGEEAQRLQLIAHLAAPCGEAHVCFRHQDARNRDRAHELQGIESRGAIEWRARYLHQLIDRHALRV